MEDEFYPINCQTCVLAYESAEESIFEGFYETANVYSAVYNNKDELSYIECLNFILEKRNDLEWLQDEGSLEI